MICSNCRADNRSEARFCKRCGNWLSPDCPICHTTLPDAAIYCDQCGALLNASVSQPTFSIPHPPDLKTSLPDPPLLTPKHQEPKTPSTPDHWLDLQLLTLEAAELIHEIARQPETEYIFRHSLTQEATYATILLRRRREFHRRVGEAIETLYPDRLDEFYSVLAYHFHQADDSRSLRYDLLAGDAAFHIYALAEALMHFSRATKVAQALGMPPDQLIHLHLRCGRCKELQGDYVGALEYYAVLETLAHQLGDSTILLAALQAQATAYTIPTRAQDAVQARRLITQALDLAQQLGDQSAQAKILWTDLILHLYSGSAQEGIPAGEQSVILARKLGLQELLAHVLQDLALVYMGASRLREGRATLAEAKPLWQELGNLAMLAENHGHACYSQIISGDLTAAIASADEAMQIATRIDNRWGQVNAHAFVALAHLALGENDDVWRKTKFGIEAGDEVGHPAYILSRIWRSALYGNLEDYAGALSLAEEADRVAERFVPFRPLSLAHLARVLLRQGREEESIVLRDRCLLHGGTQTLFVIDVWIALFDVELNLAQRRLDNAHDYAVRLIAWLADLDAIYFLPEVHRLHAQILSELGRVTEAIQALEDGLSIARRMGARHPTWLMLIELAKLEGERGNEEASRAAQDESRSLLEWITAHTVLVESKI